MEAQALPGADGQPRAKYRRPAANAKSIDEMDAEARLDFEKNVDTQTVGGQLRTLLETTSIRTFYWSYFLVRNRRWKRWLR